MAGACSARVGVIKTKNEKKSALRQKTTVGFQSMGRPPEVMNVGEREKIDSVGMNTTLRKKINGNRQLNI